MDKLIHQFELGLFFTSNTVICRVDILIEKIWKPILDAVNDRRRIKNALLSMKMQEKK
jgi:hypothetical protein